MSRKTVRQGELFTQQPRYLKMVDVLKAGTKLTGYEAAARCHICYASARIYLRYMVKTGVAHIAGWYRESEDTRGPWQAQYAFGPGEPVPKPAPTPLHKRVAKYQAKVKRDTEKHDRALAARRARQVRKLTVEAIDPLLAAMTR